jgi:hypothetical protein
MAASNEKEEGVGATQAIDVEQNALLDSAVKEQPSATGDASINAGDIKAHSEHVTTASSAKPSQQPKKKNALFRHILVCGLHELQQLHVQMKLVIGWLSE